MIQRKRVSEIKSEVSEYLDSLPEIKKRENLVVVETKPDIFVGNYRAIYKNDKIIKPK